MRTFHFQLTAQIAILCLTAVYAIAQSDGDPPSASPMPPQLESPSLDPEADNAPASPSPPGSPVVTPEPAAPAPAAPAPATPAPTTTPTVSAEVSEGDSLDSIPKDTPVEIVPEQPSKKLLGDNTPDWVKKGLLLGDEHSFAISSSLFSDVEQCREDLQSRMMAEVQAYLDKHVLTEARAEQLSKLTRDYVDKFWINQKQEFDNVQDRDNVTYHQLWIGLHISADQLKMVREWEKEWLRERRTKQAGVLGGIGIASITVLSGLVGVLARREKTKLKK